MRLDGSRSALVYPPLAGAFGRCRDLAPLVRNSGEDTLMVHSHEQVSRRYARAVIAAAKERFACRHVALTHDQLLSLKRLMNQRRSLST